MRKRMISALMIPLLLLIGCGERAAAPEDAFASFREQLNAAGSVSAEAELTVSRGGTVSAYTLAVEADAAGTKITVTEPGLIAGVTAFVGPEGTDVSYDGVMLGAGPVDEEGTSPVSALPVILRSARSGYAELYWRDGSYLAARYYVGETTACTIWLEPQSMAPVSAEIAQDGKTVISCRFTKWSMQ